MHEPWDEKAVRELSPVLLAYIGDAVFELLVRTHVVAVGNRKVKDIHLDTVQVVRAENQARALRWLWPELTPEEQDVVKRGRNAKSTVPRHASPGDYHLSTGFEALLGYLYCQGQQERILDLVNRVLQQNQS